MNRIVAGILAHVDAGKTTLSEALLYATGQVRKLGRVDRGDAFLDTNAMERQRGITIFTEPAVITTPDLTITLLDTPGHVDFSAETERTLAVLDYAILVISGADGIQGHTETLWRLLDRYHVPTFVFINKNPAHQFTFRDDHMLCIDGKPFFPIGTYRDPSDNTTVFDGIHEAQFNVTHSYKFENDKVTDADMTRYLDDCRKNGVYAFMGIPRRHLHSEDHHALKKHCAAMYDHPGLLSFYLADEPEIWINRYSMKAGADAVGDACPHVPRILLLCTPEPKHDDIAFLGNGLSEILWHDPYPVPRAPIRSVKTTMETMREICHDRQSLWCVVQAFDWDQYAVKNKKPEDVEPKAGKIRCMTHLALSANVQGIIYYWLPKERYDMRKHSPIQWAETVACARELNDLYKYLIGRIYIRLDIFFRNFLDKKSNWIYKMIKMFK